MTKLRAAGLACAISAASVAITIVASSAGPWVLILVSLGVGVAPFVLPLLAGRRVDVFEPVYLFALSYAVLFVARPAFEWTGQSAPRVAGVDPSAGYAMALSIAIIGCLSFYLGYFGPWAPAVAQRLGGPPEGLDQPRLETGLVIALAGSIGLFGFFLLEAGPGAIAALLGGRSSEASAIFSSTSGYLYASPLYVLGVGVLLLAVTRRWTSAQGLLGFALVGASQVFMITLGARSAFLPAFAMVVLLWYLRREARPRVFTILIVGVLVLSVGVTAPREFRNTTDRTASLTDTIVASLNLVDSLQSLFSSLDTAMLPDLSLEVAAVPAVIPYQGGVTYLEALARPIPRALWPNKPKGGETVVMSYVWPFQYEAGVGFSFSFFGEPYLNWGIPGVIGMSLLFGLLCRVIYVWFARASRNPVSMALFASTWPFVFVYVRGGFGPDYHRELLTVLPIAFLVLYARGRRDTLAGAR